MLAEAHRMIFLHELSLAFGDKTLFRDVSVSIQAGDRIGLVGRNGSGKTSLMKIIAGWEAPDSGSVEKATGAEVGYLPQDGLSVGEGTFLDECKKSFPDILKLQAELAKEEDRLHGDIDAKDHENTLHRISQLEDDLTLLDAQRMEANIGKVVKGLGFERDDLHKKCMTFSGGWRMRIALARLILQNPGLLMLDEPTNHLDLESQTWLESFLSQYQGALLIVSHDRGFLDRVTNRTFHIHHSRMDTYAVPYSLFEEEAARRWEELLASKNKQQREIQRVEKFVERFRYKATKAKQVQSRLKALAKVDQIELEKEDDSIAFTFPEPPRGPQKMVEMVGVKKSFGDLCVFRGLDFRLERGEKIAVVGRNGRGKSTFARILAGVDTVDEGNVVHREGVRVAWFAQHQTEQLDPNLTVLECALSGFDESINSRNVRSLLGAFLFQGDDVLKKVAVLSGGEKNRLALARILLMRANLLVLDEPTNHLDLASKTVLQGALMDYEGAVVIIAHDRDFLDPLVDRVFAFEPERIFPFHGTVSDYLRDWEERTETMKEMVSRNDKTDPTRKSKQGREARKKAALRRQELAPLRKKLQELEQEIHQTEEKIHEMESAMSQPGFFESVHAKDQVKEHQTLKEYLENVYHQWEDLGEELQGKSAGRIDE